MLLYLFVSCNLNIVLVGLLNFGLGVIKGLLLNWVVVIFMGYKLVLK